MTSDGHVEIELVYGTAQSQALLRISVPKDSTVLEAIEYSGLAEMFPDADFRKLPVGIWGRVVDRKRPVADGDRIELYRPLRMDPRDARRQLAAEGKSMGIGGPGAAAK